MAKKPANISIGKFEILATFAYAQALLGGADDDEAKRLGLLDAVKGANYRRKKEGIGGKSEPEHDRARESSVTAQAFDRQIKTKLGAYFDDVLLPAMKQATAAGLTYGEVKAIVAIPSTWGAKVTGEQLRERWEAARMKPGGKP